MPPNLDLPAFLYPGTSKPSETSFLTPGPVQSLWFGDGNVILLAGGLKFRVHQSLLGKHCGFFRDLFSLPQPPNTAADPTPDYDDGCPVLKLDDKGTDTFFLLTAIYERSFLSDSSFFSISKEAIAGVIALACKYDAPGLYAEALRRLGKIMSTTLAGLDAVDARYVPIPRRSSKPSKPSKPLKLSVRLLPSNPIFFINVARLLQLPELLSFVPCAFYIASIHTSAALTTGVPRTPDRVLCENVESEKLIHCHLNGSRGLVFVDDAAKNNCVIETLHPDDLRRVLAGRRALKGLRQEVTRCFRPHRSNISPVCGHRWRATNPCRVALARLSLEAEKDGILTNMDLLARRDGWIDNFCNMVSLEEAMLCRACKDHLKLLHNEARNQVWNDLTKHFDLVNWP